MARFKLFPTGSTPVEVKCFNDIDAAMAGCEQETGPFDFFLSSQPGTNEDLHYYPRLLFIQAFPTDGSAPAWILWLLESRNESFVLLQPNNPTEWTSCMIYGAPERVCRKCMLDRVKDREVLASGVTAYLNDEQPTGSIVWERAETNMVSE